MADLELRANTTVLCADLKLLAQAAERFPEVRHLLVDLLDGGAQLVRVHGEALPAGPAGELRIEFELADGLRDLVAAVRAGKFDGLAVDQSSHGYPSRKVVDCGK